MNIETKSEINLMSSLYKVKDGAIFLGIIYSITFLIMLPVFVKYNDSAPTLVRLSFYSLICVALVNVLFNWLYYLIVAVPLLFSGLLFVLGWSLYIYAPLFTGFIMFIFNFLTSFMSFLFLFEGLNLGLDINWIGYFSTFIEHLGQFFIAIGGIFWWFVKKGESINYKALYIYLVFLVFLGAQFGIVGLQNIFYFLFIWLLLYFKISRLDDIGHNMKGVTVLFKLGASIVVLTGISSVNLVGAGLSSRIVFEFGDKNKLLFNFYSIYQNIILILLLFGIWAPKSIIKKIIPEKIQEIINVFYKFLISKTNLFQLKI